MDNQEYECSAAEARERWTAETLFSFVTDSPSLKGVIPYHFLRWVEQAHAVAYLNVICRREFSDKKHPPRGWSDFNELLNRMRNNGPLNEQELETV